MKRVRAWLCSMGRCTECRTYETPEGIGGKCIHCGKVHGWVTSAELRAYADRDMAALRGDWETLAGDLERARRKLFGEQR